MLSELSIMSKMCMMGKLGMLSMMRTFSRGSRPRSGLLGMPPKKGEA
jgi:hypothetical protein